MALKKLLTAVAFAAIIAAIAILLTFGTHDRRKGRNRTRAPGRIFTPEQLAEYSGKGGGPLYLAVLGEVFDVSVGKRFYAEGEGYHHFVGVDGSRAFVTGEFVKDLNDNVTDFKAEQCNGLIYWRGFFHNHTEYRYQGRVVGAFYDVQGRATKELRRVEKLAKDARTVEDYLKEQEAKHPKCNSRWNMAAGGFVWCDDGLHPRKITSQAAGKATSWCACFKEVGWSDVRQVYAGCEPEATECQTSPGAGQKPILDNPRAGEELVWARPSPEELAAEALAAAEEAAAEAAPAAQADGEAHAEAGEGGDVDSAAEL